MNDDYIVVEHDDKVDLGSNSDDKVDLGSDDDYIYVDHSNDELREDESSSSDGDLSELREVKAKPIKEKIIEKGRNSRSKIVDLLSDAIRADSQLKPEEIKIVKGEYIDEGEPLHKPAPKDENVVEAEILGNDSEKNNNDPVDVVNNAFDEVLDDVFKSDNNSDEVVINEDNRNTEIIQDNEIHLENNENNHESIKDNASSIEDTQNINETTNKKVDESNQLMKLDIMKVLVILVILLKKIMFTMKIIKINLLKVQLKI